MHGYLRVRMRAAPAQHQLSTRYPDTNKAACWRGFLLHCVPAAFGFGQRQTLQSIYRALHGQQCTKTTPYVMRVTTIDTTITNSLTAERRTRRRTHKLKYRSKHPPRCAHVLVAVPHSRIGVSDQAVIKVHVPVVPQLLLPGEVLQRVDLTKEEHRENARR